MTRLKRITKATYHAHRKKGPRRGYRDEEARRGRCQILIGATIAGLLLSELGVIVGFLLFDRAVGIWFLPVVLGIGGAVATPVLDAWT